MFVIMWAIASLFKTLTNFTLIEFAKLVALVVPTIISHAQSTSGHYNLEINFKLDF